MLGGVLEPALGKLVGVASDGREFGWLAPGARAATLAAKKSVDDPKGDPEDDPEDDAVAAEEDLEEIDGDAVAGDDDLEDDDEYPEIDEDLIDLDDEWDEADEAERHDNPHKFYE